MSDAPSAVVLTPEEQSHVARGGRVLVVQQIPGPLWRVLSVSAAGCTVLLQPCDAEGYRLQRDAHAHAALVARMADDRPLVRQSRYGYTVDFEISREGASWCLRLLRDCQAVDERRFPLCCPDPDDAESALHAAYEAALQAGERWLSADRSAGPAT